MSGSCQHSKLCSILLKEAYGVNAEKVAMCLFRMGNLTLPQLVMNCRMRPSKVSVLSYQLHISKRNLTGSERSEGPHKLPAS